MIVVAIGATVLSDGLALSGVDTIGKTKRISETCRHQSLSFACSELRMSQASFGRRLVDALVIATSLMLSRRREQRSRLRRDVDRELRVSPVNWEIAELVKRSRNVVSISGRLIIRTRKKKHSASMVAGIREHESEVTEHAQLGALERVLNDMCAHLTELVEKTSEIDALDSRETRLQREAFEERRNCAREILTDTRDRLSVKIGNLERLVEALECSWVYFSGLAEAAGISNDSAEWTVLPN